ncbi:hypothetical protein NQZ68_010961 [Dissostichus eleginoides]|nr:hypothetical protein NQZ68_010961 [Dissostichus eleginoides]
MTCYGSRDGALRQVQGSPTNLLLTAVPGPVVHFPGWRFKRGIWEETQHIPALSGAISSLTKGDARDQYTELRGGRSSDSSCLSGPSGKAHFICTYVCILLTSL